MEFRANVIALNKESFLGALSCSRSGKSVPAPLLAKRDLKTIFPLLIDVRGSLYERVRFIVICEVTESVEQVHCVELFRLITLSKVLCFSDKS